MVAPLLGSRLLVLYGPGRADVLIFLYLAEFGWGRAVRYPSGAVVAQYSPVSEMSRLGFPKRSRLVDASRRVRKACPEWCHRYKRARKDFLEALKRFSATRSQESWKWYLCESGSRSIAYRSAVALRRRGGVEAYRRQHKYLYSELLPRCEERRRARQEMLLAKEEMSYCEERIFERMEVPAPLRSLV